MVSLFGYSIETSLFIEIILCALFIIFMISFIIKKRKSMVLQKILYPFLYLILYRSGFGIKFMRKIASKYKTQVQLFGYSCIGISIISMAFISISLIALIYQVITKPGTESGFALVLPFTNIPGIGYIGFSHWIVIIFLLAIIHEFAHGIVAESHGVKVKSSGFVFFGLLAPLIPGAFVEPDDKKISKQKDAVQYSIFAAGPVINILIAILLLLAIPSVTDKNSLFFFEDKITEPMGLSFEAIEGDYPAIKEGMKSGIITAVNGEKVTNYETFVNSTYGLKPGETLAITTTEKTYTILTAKAPDNPKRGYIGIKFNANEREVKPQYEFLKYPFYWLKDFFRLFFIFNFAIGMFNLLPLGIVDGGRMLKTYLDSTIKDKKKSLRIWGIISFFFLSLVILGLLINYIGNPFSLLK